LTLAWALLGTGAFVGFFLVRLDPQALYALMPAGLGYDMSQIDALYASSSARDIFFAREATSVSQNAFFGSALFSHNTRVGILAFAVGVLGGLPTALLQFYNGIMLGAISAIFMQSGHTTLYLAWILPHGVPEMTAITLCAAGGLALGHAVIAPGRRSRGEALRQARDPALAMAIASLPLFLAAAGIESFVRESALESDSRFAVAVAGAAILILLTWRVRRNRIEVGTEATWIDELLEEAPRQTPP